MPAAHAAELLRQQCLVAAAPEGLLLPLAASAAAFGLQAGRFQAACIGRAALQACI